jgi:hypothetical protein
MSQGSAVHFSIKPIIPLVLAPFLFLALPIKPIDFPSLPIAKEIDAGVCIYALGKGIDRLYLDDRRVVGLWFDGKVRQEADHVLWLSPSLISRWLGYLEAKEKWPDGELEGRWDALRAHLSGHMTFIVRLCSMPRIDPIEGEIDQKAQQEDSSDVRFLLTSSSPHKPSAATKDELLGFAIPRPVPPVGRRRVSGGIRLEPDVVALSRVQSREVRQVLDEDWWLRAPFGKALTPEFSKPPCFDDYPLGDYFASTYLVRFPIPKEPFPANSFQLRIFSPRKERIADFSLLERR